MMLVTAFVERILLCAGSVLFPSNQTGNVALAPWSSISLYLSLSSCWYTTLVLLVGSIQAIFSHYLQLFCLPAVAESQAFSYGEYTAEGLRLTSLCNCSAVAFTVRFDPGWFTNYTLHCWLVWTRASNIGQFRYISAILYRVLWFLIWYINRNRDWYYQYMADIAVVDGWYIRYWY